MKANTKEGRHRQHPHYWAFMAHRLSGLLLALFLPAHFYVLALAIQGERRLDGFLRWTEAPAVKLGEIILVGLLALHMMGGLRLLALEFLGLGETAKTAIAIASSSAAAIALLFAFNVV